MTQPQVQDGAWPPPYIDKIDRNNRTPARNQHPKDHEDLEVAVNAILDILGHAPQGQDGNLTVRLHLLTDALLDLRTSLAQTQAQLPEQIRAAFRDLDAKNRYVHQQTVTADTWTVSHGLGYDPVIEVIRDDGARILGFDLSYAPDHMSLTLSFSQAIAGRALLAN